VLARGRRKKLRAWVRWITSADGIGPGYCRAACKRLSPSDGACDVCPEPGLLPENEAVVLLFCRSTTQWRHDPTGLPTGLDYAGVARVADATGHTLQGNLFDALQELEREYLNALRDLREKGKPRKRELEDYGHARRSSQDPP
jgi:hypothetical protein